MPTERLSMRRIRDLLRLKFAQELSDRAIAASLEISKGAVGSYLSRAPVAGLSWPLPVDLDDDALDLLLFPGQTEARAPGRPSPDWASVDRELRRPGVTRALLWEEYRGAHPDGYGYAWFCEHYDAWKGRVRPTMRQTHVGGEKVFVDFAGDTIDGVDPATGEAQAMKLFVAAMGASNYIFAEARASDVKRHLLLRAKATPSLTRCRAMLAAPGRALTAESQSARPGAAGRLAFPE